MRIVTRRLLGESGHGNRQRGRQRRRYRAAMTLRPVFPVVPLLVVGGAWGRGLASLTRLGCVRAKRIMLETMWARQRARTLLRILSPCWSSLLSHHNRQLAQARTRAHSRTQTQIAQTHNLEQESAPPPSRPARGKRYANAHRRFRPPLTAAPVGILKLTCRVAATAGAGFATKFVAILPSIPPLPP